MIREFDCLAALRSERSPAGFLCSVEEEKGVFISDMQERERDPTKAESLDSLDYRISRLAAHLNKGMKDQSDRIAFSPRLFFAYSLDSFDEHCLKRFGIVIKWDSASTGIEEIMSLD